MEQTFALFGLAFTCFFLVMALALPLLLRPTAAEQRLQQVVASLRPGRPSSARAQLEQRLLQIAAGVRARVGLTLSADTQRRLEIAGYRSNTATEFYFAASWLAPLLGAFLGSFIPVNTLFCVLLLTSVGYLGPGTVLHAKVKKRKDRIRRALPDAVDLLVICVDAGLGLEQAMLRVSGEIALSAPEIHQEFQRVNSEQRAGRPRAEAWQSLTERVPLEELKVFSSMLTQADRFGTPLAKALSRFAEDLRMKRRQRAEEAAAKTKIKIVFPLVFFIFPCLFIVLLVPALLSVFHEIAGATR